MSEPGPPEGLDASLIAVLAQLWESWQTGGALLTGPAETAQDAAAGGMAVTGRPWSLAKLSKRAGLQMSTLRRILVSLDDAGVAAVLEREDSTAAAALTPEGVALCRMLFEDADQAHASNAAGAAGDAPEPR